MTANANPELFNISDGLTSMRFKPRFSAVLQLQSLQRIAAARHYTAKTAKEPQSTRKPSARPSERQPQPPSIATEIIICRTAENRGLNRVSVKGA